MKEVPLDLCFSAARATDGDTTGLEVRCGLYMEKKLILANRNYYCGLYSGAPYTLEMTIVIN